uniref:Cytochrome c oxidase copper chaperone n=2 Tax=Pygocentrus nattereri TaxID=42514 RepID=A0A3B4C123_PYGNA
ADRDSENSSTYHLSTYDPRQSHQAQETGQQGGDREFDSGDVSAVHGRESSTTGLALWVGGTQSVGNPSSCSCKIMSTISAASVEATPAIEGAQEKKPLKPCCACPETKKARDACIIEKGEERCTNLIEAHKECMRALGFKI